MFRRLIAEGSAAESSCDEFEIEGNKLVLVKRIKEEVSDIKIDRLKRETAEAEEVNHHDVKPNILDDLSRNMYVTRGAKRKLKDILNTEEVQSGSGLRPLRNGQSLENDLLKIKLEDSSKREQSARGRRTGCGRRDASDTTTPSNAPRKVRKGRRKNGNKTCDEVPFHKLAKGRQPSDDKSKKTDEEPLAITDFKEEFEDEMKAAEDYLNSPSNGVLGAGKGSAKKLPEYEFRSLYQYQIPSIDAHPIDPNPWENDPATLPEDLHLSVQSVVGLASLGCELDLMRIAEKGQNLSYDPSTFAPLVMRLKKPNSSALMFRSGRIVVSGTKSEKDSKIAADKYTEIVRQLGFPAKLLGYRVINMSATCNLQFRVRVHLLGKDLLFKNFVSYHPDMFSGACVRLTHPRCTIMIFCTGSVLITGVRSEAEAKKALQKVYSLAKIYAN